jgi:hypothetical protein
MKTLLVICAVGLVVPAAQARVKLAALPERARMVLSLAHPEATWVEEERRITLQKGVNQVDFSWGGVNLDADSIQVRMLNHADKVVVLNTSYPPGESALVWEISSPAAQEERVRISYLLSGLTRAVAYRAVAEPDETALTLRNYLRLRNDSGEDFVEAEIGLGYGARFQKTLAHQEMLELLSEKIETLPIQKILTWDAAQQPWDPEYERDTVGLPLSYILKNDAASRLGAHTLLPGKARIFVKTGGVGDGVAFTGEDWAPLTPVNRELKLYIGQSRDVKVTQRRMRADRTNIRRDRWNHEVVWDVEESYKVEIENFKKTPATLIVVEHLPGYWKMSKSSHEFTRKDAFTIEYRLALPKESKQTLKFDLVRLNVQGNNEPASY